MASSRVCKILNVAEKNDAAREISRIMGDGRVQRVQCYNEQKAAVIAIFLYIVVQREGYSKFNKIYEFDFNILGKVCSHGTVVSRVPYVNQLFHSFPS